MNQLKRILAATDLSTPARHAVERAALVSKDTSASLDLLHVANLALFERLRNLISSTPVDIDQHLLETAKHRLSDLGNNLKQRFDISVDTHLVVGSLLPELTKITKDLASDLLVCGSKGDSVVRHLTLGTTALRMLGKATYPVLVVKQPCNKSYQRILLPVDFSHFSERAISLARTIAPNAGLVLVNVYEVPFEGQLRYANVDEDTINHYRTIAKQEANKNMDDLCERAGLNIYETNTVVVHGNPIARILEQQESWDCDLIVIGKHGRNMLEEMFLGSVTKHVLSESPGDVLVSI
ncbi:universal stress protein [Methylotenera sp.]|uniref:universal stress protein n=1 Tax=Methylotenera sp. TaxID=2051956 RepID=UPI00273685BD|nr:universal stress protein [Methylotenera sp.]MDP3211766.1 universal stress protein [Methylotenera sp.]